jgi:adenylate cyclase
VTASVVAEIQPSLVTAEIQRAQRKPTENLQAYDLMLRAIPHLSSQTREGVAEAIRLLRRAIEIDPTYAPGLAFLALCYFELVSQNWMERDNPMVTEMIHLARSAVALDSNDSEILRIAAFIIALPGGDLNGGMALISKAISLNPNNSQGIRTAGQLYAYAGDTKSAFAYLERSIRLIPTALSGQ